MPACLFCQKAVATADWYFDQQRQKRSYYCQCDRCGTYRMAEYVVQVARQSIPGPDARRIISGGIRERVEAGEEVYISDLDACRQSIVPPADPLEMIDRFLLHVFRKSERAGAEVRISLENDYPLAFAHDAVEFAFLLARARDLNFINWNGQSIAGCSVGVEGWRQLRNLKHQERDSRQAFVAMWFDPPMNTAFTEGIAPALTDTGYNPLRLDFAEYNEKVDDRIIAEIKRSGLIVADFTGHRGGVYFEAGFALGLGIPVIWTCRDDQAADLHFDTRQYNHILWSDPADLRRKLTWRIEATLPRGTKGERG